MKDRTKTILLFLSVIIMIVMFAMNVWDNLGFIKGKNTLRQHIYRERNPKVISMSKERFK